MGLGRGRVESRAFFFSCVLGGLDLPLSSGAGAPAVAGGARGGVQEKRGPALAWAAGVGLGAEGSRGAGSGTGARGRKEGRVSGGGGANSGRSGKPQHTVPHRGWGSGVSKYLSLFAVCCEGGRGRLGAGGAEGGGWMDAGRAGGRGKFPRRRLSSGAAPRSLPPAGAGARVRACACVRATPLRGNPPPGLCTPSPATGEAAGSAPCPRLFLAIRCFHVYPLPLLFMWCRVIYIRAWDLIGVCDDKTCLLSCKGFLGSLAG